MGIFGKKEEFFGLDIGSQFVRIVELKGVSRKPALVTYGSAALPSGLSQSDSKADIKNLSQIVKQLVKSTKATVNGVVAGLPGSSVFTAVVKLPQMTQTELAKAIKWQAEQNLPLKLDEVKLDWQVIEKPSSNSSEMSVMIVAAPINKVEKLMNILEGAGLSVVALETTPIALSRSLGKTLGVKVMIVDIGAVSTEIAIVQDGVTFHSRSIAIGGEALTRAISQNLGLDNAQAEQFKRKFGLTQERLEGQVFKSLKPILTNIIEEIERSVKFYQEEFNEKVDKIILSGGGAYLLELPAFLKSALNLEVYLGNPWSDISYPAGIQDELNSNAPEFATAIGLAMRG